MHVMLNRILFYAFSFYIKVIRLFFLNLLEIRLRFRRKKNQNFVQFLFPVSCFELKHIIYYTVIYQKQDFVTFPVKERAGFCSNCKSIIYGCWFLFIMECLLFRCFQISLKKLGFTNLERRSMLVHNWDSY